MVLQLASMTLCCKGSALTVFPVTLPTNTDLAVFDYLPFTA